MSRCIAVAGKHNMGLHILVDESTRSAHHRKWIDWNNVNFVLIECFLRIHKYSVCILLLQCACCSLSFIASVRTHTHAHTKRATLNIFDILSRKQSVCQFYLCSIHVAARSLFISACASAFSLYFGSKSFPFFIKSTYMCLAIITVIKWYADDIKRYCLVLEWRMAEKKKKIILDYSFYTLFVVLNIHTHIYYMRVCTHAHTYSQINIIFCSASGTIIR